LYAVEQGGGALLDVGVYAVAFVQSIFEQKPVKIQSLVNFAPNGVDSINATLFQYEGGEIARLFTGLMADEPQDAVISGENGHIYVPRFWAPTHAVLCVKGEEEQTTQGGFDGEGFQFEFDAVRRDVLAGQIENEWVPHAFTLSVAELLDYMKAAW
jgi:predicted dehydrogenase